MKVAVCIKQVQCCRGLPLTMRRRRLCGRGVPLEVNSYDLLAVDRAAQLKEQDEYGCGGNHDGAAAGERCAGAVPCDGC